MTCATEPLDEPTLDATGESVSVVIPAFNEEQGIATTVEELRGVLDGLGRPYEIVIVDDGSTDQTCAEAERLGVKVIRHRENRGYGASLKTGILATESPFVVITDADGTYPAEGIPALFRESDGADMVVAARALNSRGIALIRRPAKWLLNRLAEFLAGRKIPDLNSGLRLFRRESLIGFLPILPSGFSFTTTITLAMLCNDYQVEYVPTDYRRRIGKSKIQAFDLIRFIVLVLRTIVLFNPLKVFLPLGAMLFLLGAAKFVYDVTLLNLSESAVMAFLAAIVVWSLGLLADMIGRLHLIGRRRDG